MSKEIDNIVEKVKQEYGDNLPLSDNLDKYICKNARQIKGAIKEGKEYIIAYNDVKVTNQLAKEIHDKKIRIIGFNRKEVQELDNKRIKNNE